MDKELFEKYLVKEKETGLRVRNQKEDLIKQIVEGTVEKNKKQLAKMLAIQTHTFKWTVTDLHSLLRKKDDPQIRNYTAFVKSFAYPRKK